VGDRATASGPKSGGGAAVPLSVGGAGSPSNTVSPGLRPTSVASGILIIQLFGHNMSALQTGQDNGPIA